MCVYWYFAEHFLELSYHFFSKSKGRILDKMRVSFKDQKKSLNQRTKKSLIVKELKKVS